MKRIYNYTDPIICEELLSMPIKALRLPKEVENALNDIYTVNSSCDREKTINTVRDLLERGKERVASMLSRQRYHNQNPSMIVDIEEKLMKLGFRFSDSDFTPYRVRIKELSITENTKAFVEKYINGAKTIEDICLKNVWNLADRIDGKDYSALVDLKFAMEEYGVKFIDGQYDLDPARAFPIGHCVYYLSESTIDEYEKNAPKKPRLVRSRDFVNKELKKKIKIEDEPLV